MRSPVPRGMGVTKMIKLVHLAAGLVGLGIIGCVAHGAVLAAGGYGATSAPMLVALACGLAIGSIAIGVAWRERRLVNALLIAGALVAGEAYALLLTAERTLDAREAKQAPLRVAQSERLKAQERITAAQRSLTDTSTSVRLSRALAAKAAADAAVVEKAAHRDCASNCRVLLEQQVTTAAAEVEAARAELTKFRDSAVAELGSARASLAALPPALSASPLADRLGVEGWKVDLAAAALSSVALNGLGSFLLAFAAHGRREVTIDLKPIAVQSERSAAAEADMFARSVFRPMPGGRISIVEMRAAYDAWARARGLEPLPTREIGAALAELFARVGVYREGNGATAAIVGLRWTEDRAGAAPTLVDGRRTLRHGPSESMANLGGV